jgi:hypothetical protein
VEVVEEVTEVVEEVVVEAEVMEVMEDMEDMVMEDGEVAVAEVGGGDIMALEVQPVML